MEIDGTVCFNETAVEGQSTYIFIQILNIMTTTTEGRQPTVDPQSDGGIIGKALTTVEQELEIATSEHAALESFQKRVAKIDPSHVTEGVSDSATPLVDARERNIQRQQQATQPALTRVKTAYCETVMSLNHYNTESEETYVESVAIEFGEEIAYALGGSAVFTNDLKERLLSVVGSALNEWHTFISQLTREKRALDQSVELIEDFREELNVIESRPLLDCSNTEIQRLHTDIRELERRCNDLVERRQTSDLHTTSTLHHSTTRQSLCDYLYQSLDVRYPILHEAATVSIRIDAVKSDIETYLDAKSGS